jgi:hypothetical protein
MRAAFGLKAHSGWAALVTLADGLTSGAVAKQMAALGKSVGPPWGKDQKNGALAALVALRGQST